MNRMLGRAGSAANVRVDRTNSRTVSNRHNICISSQLEVACRFHFHIAHRERAETESEAELRFREANRGVLKGLCEVGAKRERAAMTLELEFRLGPLAVLERRRAGLGG